MSNENLNDTQGQTEPMDIAQAFRMYNQMEREKSQESMAGGEAGSGDTDAESEESGGAGPDDEGSEYSEGEDYAPESDGEDDDGTGGSANLVEPIDYNPAKQALLKDIQNAAVQQVRKEMADQQIELWSMQDIYERDENTGRVTFHNPDDPNRPFSSRAEAQQFIDAMNKEVTNHFRNEVNKKQRELLNQQAPRLQVLDFAPTYNAMSATEQEVFNDLAEDYAITDNQGNVVGFNVNLNTLATRAKKIAKRFNSGQEQQQASQSQQQQRQPVAGSRPAMDMKTGVSSTGEGDLPEPKTIGEALKLYDTQQREAKKKGKK